MGKFIANYSCVKMRSYIVSCFTENKSELSKYINYDIISKIMCAYTHIHSLMEKYFTHNIEMEIILEYRKVDSH